MSGRERAPRRPDTSVLPDAGRKAARPSRWHVHRWLNVYLETLAAQQAAGEAIDVGLAAALARVKREVEASYRNVQSLRANSVGHPKRTSRRPFALPDDAIARDAPLERPLSTQVALVVTFARAALRAGLVPRDAMARATSCAVALRDYAIATTPSDEDCAYLQHMCLGAMEVASQETGYTLAHRAIEALRLLQEWREGKEPRPRKGRGNERPALHELVGTAAPGKRPPAPPLVPRVPITLRGVAARQAKLAAGDVPRAMPLAAREALVTEIREEAREALSRELYADDEEVVARWAAHEAGGATGGETTVDGGSDGDTQGLDSGLDP